MTDKNLVKPVLIALLMLTQAPLVICVVRSSSVTLQGKQLQLSGFDNDILFRHILKTGEWDVDIIDLAKALFPRGDENYFDIGANLGFMTMQFSLLANRGNVFAWEPHPSNFMLLQKNIQDNDMGNVHIFNNAVADEDMIVCIPRFKADQLGSTGEDIVPRKRHTNNGDIKLSDRGDKYTVCTGKEVAIKTMKLDTFNPNIRSLDFIKIGKNAILLSWTIIANQSMLIICFSDVQGYELRVLKTLLPLVEKYKPFIVVEFEEWNMKRMRDTYSTIDIVNFIRRDMHYEIFLISTGYPVDHLLVSIDRLPAFRAQFGRFVQPLTKPNSVNRNVEAGVVEQICMIPDKCNSWRGIFQHKKSK